MLPRVNLVRGDRTDFLLFSTDDFISRHIVAQGHWGKRLVDISEIFLTKIERPLVVDIGANLGAYAIPLAQKLAEVGGAVYAYEPQRIVFQQLCGNAFLNRLDNVHAFNLAIGETSGALEIPAFDYARSKNIGGFAIDDSHVADRTTVSRTSDGATETVVVARLDDLTFPRAPDLLKIDVEGHELQVLRGAAKCLRHYGYPPLFMEAWTEDWFKAERAQLIAHLNEMGYETFALGDDIIAQHKNGRTYFEIVQNDRSGLSISRVR